MLTVSSLKKQLLLQHPKLCSSHCWLDDEGWYGSLAIYYGRYHVTLRHRWSRRVLLDQMIWSWEKGYDELVRSWSDVMAKFVRRLSHEEKGSVGSGHAEDPDFARDRPALHEHLTCDWLDGSRRVTSALGVSVDGGKWKARLADRENGMVLFVSGDSFEGILDAVEGALTVGEPDWRVDQYARPSAGGKKRG